MHEIHAIECEHLKTAGIVLNDTDVFNFRSKALKYILDDTDRKVLAHYEDLSAELATINFYLDENERKQFDAALQNEYGKKCN